MISRQRLSNVLEACLFLIGLVMLFNTNSANANVHLSVQVFDPLAFRDYFWVDQRFGGLLSDFIELADGTHNIEVFGPPGPSNFFYALTISVEVVKSKPGIQSVSFQSYCANKGIQSLVKEWPAPLIISDERFSGAFRLVIGNPVVTERDTPCTPPEPPLMARWADIGVLKLITTSAPPGAEVWVDGRLTGKTNSTINVPYRDKREKIKVVIRMPGYVNCEWMLTGPFEGETPLHCIRKTPGSH